MCRADANSASLGCCVILAINDDFHVTDALDLMLINVEFRGGGTSGDFEGSRATDILIGGVVEWPSLAPPSLVIQPRLRPISVVVGILPFSGLFNSP